MAKGVGTARIIGRVHLVPIQIGKSFFNCSFTILEDQSMEFLLGLDMLKGHQACIDLMRNELRIGEESVPFLGEGDLPMRLRDNAQQQDAAQSVPPPASSAPAPAAAAPSNTPSSSTNAPESRSFPRESLVYLMELGASEEQAVALLQQSQGDVNLAANLFLQTL